MIIERTDAVLNELQVDKQCRKLTIHLDTRSIIEKIVKRGNKNFLSMTIALNQYSVVEAMKRRGHVKGQRSEDVIWL